MYELHEVTMSHSLRKKSGDSERVEDRVGEVDEGLGEMRVKVEEIDKTV